MFFFLLFIGFYLGATISKFTIVNIIVFLIFVYKNKAKKKNLLCFVICFILGIIIYSLISYLSLNLNIGIVVSSKNNYIIFQTVFKKYYVYIENNPYEVFDILKIEGEITALNFTTYESQFDFNQYLNEKLVFSQIDATIIKPYFLSIFRIKNLILNSLQVYDESVRMILSSLLFNLNSSKEYSDLIFDNNLGYYLTISSYHVYFFLSIIEKLIRTKMNEKKTSQILILISLFLYLFSNYKISILKLIIYRIIEYKNKRIQKLDRLGVICLTHFCVGIIDISFLTSTSFFYSFPLNILLYYSYEAMLKIKKRERKWYYLCLINLYFIPLNHLNNQYFSILSLPFSLIISPLILFTFVIGIISLFLPLQGLVIPCCKSIEYFINFFDKINIKLYSTEFNFFISIIFYFLIIVCLYYIETKRNKKLFSILVTMFSIILICSLPINNLYIQEVVFINVGQGDCILIRDKNHNYLIDTGGVYNNDLAKHSLIPYFKKNHVRNLDCLFITHDDYDHCGAKESLMGLINIKNIVDKNNFKVMTYHNLDFINLNRYKYLWKNENDSSLVIYLNFNNASFLFMGDASSEIEKQIINDYKELKVDYLKVGHHGSNTSTCEEFVKNYLPKEAIISCGANNYYSHPHLEVIDILTKYDVKIRRTDLEGTIKIKV